jgi:type IV pilus assembly protein PilF
MIGAYAPSRCLALGVVGVIMASVAGCVSEPVGTVTAPASRAERLEAQVNLARGYLESEAPARALAPLDRALAIDSNSADALGLYAVYYLRESEPRLAETYFRRALRSDPAHAPNLNNFAALLLSEGRYREALDPLRRLVENTGYPGRPRVFERLGEVERRLGDSAAAREAFNRALALDPALEGAALGLVSIALDAGDLETAKRYFVSSSPRGAPTLQRICVGQRLATRTGDANLAASLALALRSGYPEAADPCAEPASTQGP